MVGRRAREPGERAGAVDDRAARPGAPAGRPGARSAARAAAQSTGTAASAACVGVEQETAATSSISVRSVWWPTEAMTGTRSIATVRHSVSSQNANRSASEPPPRATTITSTCSQAARSCSARVIAGAAWRSCTGANAHTTRPRPAAAAQPGEHVVARLAALAGDDADRARQRRARQPLLRLEQALGVQRAAQPLELGQQVALAGQPQAGDREGELRRGGARARGSSRSRPRRRPARRRRASASPSASQSSRHIEHGSAPAPSRSSNHTRARPALKPNTSPKTCTRANSRRRSRSARRVVRRPGTAPRARSRGCPRARAGRRRAPALTRVASASARTTAGAVGPARDGDQRVDADRLEGGQPLVERRPAWWRAPSRRSARASARRRRARGRRRGTPPGTRAPRRRGPRARRARRRSSSPCAPIAPR